jgi:hypothetical protein
MQLVKWKKLRNGGMLSQLCILMPDHKLLDYLYIYKTRFRTMDRRNGFISVYFTIKYIYINYNDGRTIWPIHFVNAEWPGYIVSELSGPEVRIRLN